ncbi:MAG: hypothetical protein KAG66_09270 [Methylococcales bacterium]|nr:hypothetical protein [Methylococcales bacterium]
MLNRRVVVIIIGALQLASVLRPVVLYAADTDLVAPVVRLSLDLGSHQEGMPISVSATVTDNQRVKQVSLRYRSSGSSDEFLSTPMTKNAATQVFSASIPATAVMAPGVAYFVEATDAEGNISQQPFPSHPQTAVIESERSITVSSKINWWWVVAGVVAAGAVAGGRTGSDSSGTAVNGEGSEGLTVVAPVP